MAQNGRLARLEVDVVGPTGNSGKLARVELTVADTNAGRLARVELVTTRRSLYRWNGTSWDSTVLYTWTGSWVAVS